MVECLFVDLAAATDADLVRAMSGEFAAGAEEELCRRLGPRVRLYGLRHLRDEQAAADLTQQVLLAMLESLRAGRVREPEKLASFVLGTCRLMVLDLRRGARRREHLLGEYARTLQPLPAMEPLDTARLQYCLQRLGERERTVVMLTYYEEQDRAALAESLGLSAANSRVIRHRALQRLRECMGAA